MIEVIHYEKANKGKVIGYVDIKLPKWGMIIRKIAHLQNENKTWFNLPTFTRGETAAGKPQYLRYWQLELDAHNGQLLQQLGEKVKEYCEKNQIKEAAPVNFDDEMPF